MIDDQELERVLRRGLDRHAGDADSGAPVAERAGRVVRRRRRQRRGAGLVAAAAVAVVASLAAAEFGRGPVEPAPPVATDPTDAPGDPTRWRTEVWGALAVQVPVAWGYGGAPTAGGAACRPVAMRSATGERLPGEQDPDRGWVGRPVTLTDDCVGYPWIAGAEQENPRAPYVWLGAAVDVGVVEYDNGYVQETVEVEGETLTVASDDEGLRKRIVESARPVEQDGPVSCRPSYGNTVPAGAAGTTTEGRGELLSATVCAYRAQADDGGDFVLTYATELAPQAAAAAYRAQEAAPPVTHDDACMGDLTEFVVLEAEYDAPFGDDNLARRAVYTMACAGEVDLGADARGATAYTQLVPQGAAPWAVGGIGAVVDGPAEAGWARRYFIGQQG